MNLELEWHPFDTLGLLTWLALNNAMSPQVAHMLKTTLANDEGYIAGGFARLIMSSLMAISGYDHVQRDNWDPIAFANLVNDVKRYLGTRDHVKRMDPWKSKKNDIDIFFANENDRDRHNVIWNVTYEPFPSPGNHAVTYFIDNVNLVQAIQTWTAPVERMLGSFDITNACVAFTKDAVCFPKCWPELERDRLLHVRDWNTTRNTTKRIMGWMAKHNYTALHPENAVSFNHHLLELFGEFKTSSLISSCKNYVMFKSYRSITSMLGWSPVAKSLSSSVLVFLASLEPFESEYAWAGRVFTRSLDASLNKQAPAA